MTSFTDEVRETVSPHKFGGSRKAAALWLASMDSSQDEQTGDAMDWHYWVARFGRHLLFTDPQGFVWVDTHSSEDEAKHTFQEIDQEYCADTDSYFLP